MSLKKVQCYVAENFRLFDILNIFYLNGVHQIHDEPMSFAHLRRSSNSSLFLKDATLALLYLGHVSIHFDHEGSGVLNIKRFKVNLEKHNELYTQQQKNQMSNLNPLADLTNKIG